MKVVIGLGSNMGDKHINVRTAINTIALLPTTKVLRVSSLYKTSAVGYKNQGFFINAVAEVETELTPRALLGACLGIEASMGRVRSFEDGPRIIDIDILLIENKEISSKELTVPHPKMLKRAFVMKPLQELYPYNSALGFYFDMSQTDKSDSVAII